MIYVDSLDNKVVELVKHPFISGLTTNPTIVKRDKPEWGFQKTIEFLESIPGNHFAQGSIRNDNWLEVLHDKIKHYQLDPIRFTIKLGWTPTEAGKFVPELKKLNLKICATAVYTYEQCYTAIMSGVDYVAVYFDRMNKNGINAMETIEAMVKLSNQTGGNTRILAASIKSVNDANNLLKIGVPDLTLPLDVTEKFIDVVYPQNDLNVFESDYCL